MSRIEVSYSTAFYVMSSIVGVLTLGIGFLLMFLVVPRKWPRVADQEGLTLRNGKRFLWSQLTNHQAVTVVGPGGIRTAGRLDLIFGTYVVHVVPVSITPAQELIAFIGEQTGRQMVSG
jgi:hypothetical protein